MPLVNITEKIMLSNHIYSNLHHAASVQQALTMCSTISLRLRLIFSISGKTQCSSHTPINGKTVNLPVCCAHFQLIGEDCLVSRADSVTTVFKANALKSLLFKSAFISVMKCIMPIVLCCSNYIPGFFFHYQYN